MGLMFRGGILVGVGFSALVQTGPGAHPTSCFDHSPPSSAEVKERVELYTYPTPRAFVDFYRGNFTFFF